MASPALAFPATRLSSVSRRANLLAQRLERGAQALIALAATLSEAEWRTPVGPRDGRTVGVVVHHVASMYPLEIDLALKLAAGTPLPPVTMETVHLINAEHAEEHREATRVETIALLKRNSATAAAAIRALSDEELDRAAPAKLYFDAPITCQFMLEDHAVRHSYHHLARIRATLHR